MRGGADTQERVAQCISLWVADVVIQFGLCQRAPAARLRNAARSARCGAGRGGARHGWRGARAARAVRRRARSDSPAKHWARNLFFRLPVQIAGPAEHCFARATTGAASERSRFRAVRRWLRRGRTRLAVATTHKCGFARSALGGHPNLESECPPQRDHGPPLAWALHLTYAVTLLASVKENRTAVRVPLTRCSRSTIL